jgi:predicted dehydrogenase
VSGRDVRWGIAGTGAIAAGFADALSQTAAGILVGVGSRTAEAAETFAERFDIPNRHGSYTDLAEDDEVDVVYVATPQSRHAPDTLLYLDAGKHVLCEKPFALDADQARSMVALARARNLFLMEAMWTRFLPAYRVLAEVLREGRIGEPLLVEADFGWRRDIDPDHRLFRRDLGGGGLLDLGIYPLQLCSLVLGPPVAVSAQGVIGSTGVDEVVAAVLRHPGGEVGVVKAGLRVGMACTGRIAGTHGVIEIPALMHCPESIRVSAFGSSEDIDATYEGNGLRFEIDEVHRCITDGQLESPTMPLDETVRLASTIDEIRSQIGLRFDDV